MKRLFTLIVALSAIFAAMAQYPMATLSRNGELTQFTGIHALDEALKVADQIGDIIYLSEGTFSSTSMGRTIAHGVSIIGSGYNSKILGEVRICRNDGKTTKTPTLDGVNIRKVSLDYNMDGADYLEIRNCHIEELVEGGHVGGTFVINRCFINNLHFNDCSESRQVYVNNSKIGYLGWGSQFVIVNNCNIKNAENCPRILSNSIIAGTPEENGKLRTWENGTHVINNSLFPSKEFVSSENDNDSIQEGTTINNCYFENPANGLLDENLNCTIDLAAKGYLGQDGTIIGAYGGEHPFTERPSVPTIDSEKSSVEYDAAAKKLNVTITVAND